MHDSLLQMASNASVVKASLNDFTFVPTIAAYLYISDGIPIADLGGVAVGHEGVTLHITCTEDFAEAVGAVEVEWRLVSVASSDPAVLSLEIAGLTYNIHWSSGITAAATYVRGRRIATVPLSPTRSYKPFLYLLGYFKDAGSPMDGLTAGKISARLCGTPETGAFTHFPNAI
jgi:hypothetical protein